MHPLVVGQVLEDGTGVAAGKRVVDLYSIVQRRTVTDDGFQFVDYTEVTRGDTIGTDKRNQFHPQGILPREQHGCLVPGALDDFFDVGGGYIFVVGYFCHCSGIQ